MALADQSKEIFNFLLDFVNCQERLVFWQRSYCTVVSMTAHVTIDNLFMVTNLLGK